MPVDPAVTGVTADTGSDQSSKESQMKSPWGLTFPAKTGVVGIAAVCYSLVSVEFSYCSWVVRQPFHDQRATRTTTSMS